MDISPNSETNNQSVAKYQTYQELSNDLPKLEESFFEEITAKKEILDWKVCFDYIDDLRKFNRYHPEEFLLFLQKIIPFLVFNLNNLRSNLIKNALILVKEIFEYNGSFFLFIPQKDPKSLEELIPVIYEKANNDKAFLKNEAKEAILQLEKKCPLDENVLRIILGLTQEKNSGISEKASCSLVNIIRERQEEILQGQTSKENIFFLIKVMSNLLESNRMLIKKHGEEILLILSKIETFDVFLENTLGNQEKTKILKTLEDKTKAAGKIKESFKDFISKKKQDNH